MTRHIYIDADVLGYWSAFAMQHSNYYVGTNKFDNHKAFVEWCKEQQLNYKDVPVEKEETILDLKYLPNIISQRVQHIYAQCGTASATFYLSGKGNYRYDICVTKPYKGNRSDAPKPKYHEQAKDILLNTYGAVVVNGQEADDALGIALTNDNKGIVATIDKDLDMLPGLHYNWGKELRYRVTPTQAIYKFCHMMLTGDSTDNIPGIKGIGDKGATAMLEPFKDRPWFMWNEVNKAYDDDPEEYLTEQGQLLWIRRVEDELWTPELFEEVYLEGAA